MPTASPSVTAADILAELKPLAKDSYKQTLLRHGIAEPLLGVSIENLKKIQKRLKKDYELALHLFDTGVYDAMYLAGLIADHERMTKKDLQHWVEKASCDALCTYTVAGVAADSPHGWELGLKWIDAKKPTIAAAGWAALGGVMSTRDDDELDLKAIKQLLKRVEKEIQAAPDRVRYNMNNFLISVAAYIAPLYNEALAAAERIGEVQVDMGDTACKVPFAPDYIRKIKSRGSIGKKRKTARC
jgi:3-methyladenine DNA glycosylase AlkD